MKSNFASVLIFAGLPLGYISYGQTTLKYPIMNGMNPDPRICNVGMIFKGQLLISNSSGKSPCTSFNGKSNVNPAGFE